MPFCNTPRAGITVHNIGKSGILRSMLIHTYIGCVAVAAEVCMRVAQRERERERGPDADADDDHNDGVTTSTPAKSNVI